MRFSDGIRIALRSLKANKLRSALTMLGVIIGIGAVVALVAVGEGMNRSVIQRIEAMGSNLIRVGAGEMAVVGTRAAMVGVDAETLTLEDAEAIRRLPTVKEVAPLQMFDRVVTYGSQSHSARIVGVTTSWHLVRAFTLKAGRFIAEEDLKAMAKVAVLGDRAREALFGDNSPLGKTIRIAGIDFQVVGTLERKGPTYTLLDWDDAIYIPLTTTLTRVFNIDYLHAIFLQAKDQDAVKPALEQITALLRARHNIVPPKKDDFTVQNLAEFLETAKTTTRALTFLLGSIAAISLLVGGIGIMNIMLVSVNERVSEIGLRKVVGARRRDLRLQFLTESLLLTLFGGLVGIGVGIGASRLLSAVLQAEAFITLGALGLALLFAILVGLFFGVYPAERAARWNPIDALRYE